MTLLLALLCLQDDSSEEAKRFLEEARKLQSERKYEEALASIDKAIALQPSASAHLQRGMILMGLNRKDEAAKSWDKALDLDPKLKGMIEELKSGRGPKRRHDEKGFQSGPERPMSPEDLEKALPEVQEYLKKSEPEMLRRLEELIAGGRREELMHFVWEIRSRMRNMEELKQRDPEEYARLTKMREMERACFELSEKIRRGEHGGDELRKQLADKLAELFELREQSRARELADLKRRVEELEKVLQKRRENRQKIVEKKMREMLGERDPEDW